MRNQVPLDISRSGKVISPSRGEDGETGTPLGRRGSGTRGPRAMASTFPRPGQAAQDGRPRGRAAPRAPAPPAARGRRALLMSKYGQGCPAPPTPARDSRRAAAATVLPRRHLGPCHVSRGAGRGWGRHQIQGPPRRFSLPGAGPRSPYPEASASRGHPNRGHASRALVKPLPPPRRRPAAGRAQAS